MPQKTYTDNVTYIPQGEVSQKKTSEIISNTQNTCNLGALGTGCTINIKDYAPPAQGGSTGLTGHRGILCG
jgi:hypothetical protein